MCEKGKDFEVYPLNDNNGEYECWRTPPGNIGIINYRYLLKKRGDNPLIIIGCNPSKANEDGPDPTMRLVNEFCEKNGYGGYIMLNLYPQIAPRVRELPIMIDNNIHAVNVCAVNIGVIKEILQNNNDSNILFAFGTIVNKRKRLFRKCYECVKNLINLLIENKLINKNQIKKLAKKNSKDKKIKIFSYPPHFSNREFNEKNVERVISKKPFNFKKYNIGLVKRKSKKTPIQKN